MGPYIEVELSMERCDGTHTEVQLSALNRLQK